MTGGRPPAGRRTCRGPRRFSAEHGQATIELVALVPLILTAAIAATAILAHEGARERAGEAAHAGAMALLQDEDARAAARAALPADERDDARITVGTRRVRVVLPSRGMLHAFRPSLVAAASADTGPEPAP